MLQRWFRVQSQRHLIHKFNRLPHGTICPGPIENNKFVYQRKILCVPPEGGLVFLHRVRTEDTWDLVFCTENTDVSFGKVSMPYCCLDTMSLCIFTVMYIFREAGLEWTECTYGDLNLLTHVTSRRHVFNMRTSHYPWNCKGEVLVLG